MLVVKALNPKAEVAQAQVALVVNISVAQGLQNVLRSNLRPKGTLFLVLETSGLHDGNILLCEMQIQPPTASSIAKVTTSQ